MSISKLLVSAAFLTGIGFALPASASVVTGSWEKQTAFSPAKQQILARQGADDGAGDTRRSGEGASHARNGADDGAGHDANDRKGEGANHARNGADDGAGHDANDRKGEGANHARNGADDGAGHDANDRKGEGPGHA
jgi:hypothetical protein